MNTGEAEQILSDAMKIYAKDRPSQKKEIQEALEVLLEKIRTATALAADCNKALLECLAMMTNCPVST
jgi:hypothetical protein